MPAPKKNPVSSIAKQVVKKARNTKTARALQNKASKEFGLEKGTTVGKMKSVKKAEKLIAMSNEEIMAYIDKGNKLAIRDVVDTARLRGSNKKLAKGLVKPRGSYDAIYNPNMTKKTVRKNVKSTFDSGKAASKTTKSRATKKSSMPIKKKK
jgi:N-acetylglucosamine kinase-like BadF-type ATPase